MHAGRAKVIQMSRKGWVSQMQGTLDQIVSYILFRVAGIVPGHTQLNNPQILGRRITSGDMQMGHPLEIREPSANHGDGYKPCVCCD
jgi:hypothetical protein